MKNRIKFNAILAVSLGLAFFTLAADKGKPHEKKDSKEAAVAEHPQSGDSVERRGAAPETAISPSEREIIRTFVDQRTTKPGEKAHRLPPGLAKKMARGGKLPPGWEKKLQPGQVVSADIWSETHSLPKEILAKLPPPPPGTILVAVEGRVARIIEKTREILDVFDAVP